MAVRWGEPLRKGLGFCWNPKRWLPFFITDLVCALLILLYINCNMSTFLAMVTFLSLGSTGYLYGFLVFLVPVLVVGILCALVNLWIEGAVIYQSYREKESRKSWGISAKRYPSLLAAVIVTGILTYLVSLSYTSNGMSPILHLGSLLAFIVSVILFFPLQIIIVRKQGFWNALVGSWQMFRDQARKKLISNKNILLLIFVSEIISMPALIIPTYLSIYMAVLSWVFCWVLVFVFLSLLVFSRVCNVTILIAIVSFTIILIFSVPFILVFWNITMIVQATYSLGSGAIVLMGLKSVIKESLLPLASSGIILLIGFSISKAFTLKAKTEFYLRFRKRLLGLI